MIHPNALNCEMTAFIRLLGIFSNNFAIYYNYVVAKYRTLFTRI